MALKDLFEKVKGSNFTIGVVGLGRAGLPLAVTFAFKGIKTVGYDVNYDVVDTLNDGQAPFFEEKMDEYVRSTVRNGKFQATTNPRVLGKCDVIIIAVGTPITKSLQPEFNQIYSALDRILDNNIEDKLIIHRSTSTPTTLEDIIKPYLENKSGLKAGVDFGLAVCPERIAEGTAIIEIEDLPEIVGGIDNLSSEITAEVFKKIDPNKVISILSPKAASLAKLFANVYRYVNFALANEFGLISERYGEDAFKIIDATNKNYLRGKIAIPGLAGGPCLSKDGYYLVSNSSFPDFVMMAWRLNESLPAEIVERVRKELEKKGKKLINSKIGVLGLVYKAAIDDVRESPSLRLIEILKSNGAEVYIHDPRVSKRHAREFGIELSDLDTALNDVDAIILATNHPEFKELEKRIENNGGNKILFDCWGMYDGSFFRNIKYLGLGKGNSN